MNNLSYAGTTPFDNCAGHGTHVAGIIAADARNANASQPFIGVAPGATLYMYRIFGCTGGTSTELIIDAMSRAFVDGAQILSLSLGGTDGWSEEPANVVGERIASRGTFLSIAAGNDGAAGAFDASSPASGLGSTAVASVDNAAFVSWNALTSNGSKIVRPCSRSASDTRDILQ